MCQIFLVATATVFLSASINVMPTKFVSRLHRWKYLWSMCNATVGCKLLSGEKLRREVCELKDISDFFNVCTAKFAPAELLLSSSLRIFEMTSDVRVPTVTFSIDVLSPRPHGVPIHR